MFQRVESRHISLNPDAKARLDQLRQGLMIQADGGSSTQLFAWAEHFRGLTVDYAGRSLHCHEGFLPAACSGHLARLMRKLVGSARFSLRAWSVEADFDQLNC